MTYFLSLVIFFSLFSSLAYGQVPERFRLASVVEVTQDSIDARSERRTLEPWEKFELTLVERERMNSKAAWAYGISGGLVLIGGGVGLNRSSDNLEKFAFAMSQSLAVASIAYGVHLNMVQTEHETFYRAVESVPSITLGQKNELLRGSYQSRKASKKRQRWIRLITHGLVSGLNFYQGSQNKNEAVRDGLYFVGGVNLLALISLGISEDND